MRAYPSSVPDPVSGLPIGHETQDHAAKRPERVTLSGRFVTLEPLDADRHAAEIWGATHGGEKDRIWEYLFETPFPDEAAFRAHIERKAASEDPLFYAIIDNATGKAVGYETLMRIDPAHRSIEVGNILYGAPLQRTAGATEAQYLLMRYAFDDLGYRRYEWKCNGLNAPSRRAALRFGFRFEGLFRQHMIVKGRNRDTAWFSIIDTEWPTRKAMFEAWLAPENFDDEGRQKQSLGDIRAQQDTGLRRAGLDDLDQLTALQHAAFAENRIALGVPPLAMTADYAEALQTSDVWFLEEDGEVIGAVILTLRPDDVLLWSIATHPSMQGQGVGNRLLAIAEQKARALGRNTIRLYTGAPLTARVAWYQRHGYRVERRETLPDRDLVHMIKTLR
jgi:RimJ/RimL family protein N-acetyltransferase